MYNNYMGLLKTLFSQFSSAAESLAPAPVALQAPEHWSSSGMLSLITNDLGGITPAVVTRATAMTVPSVVAARAELLGPLMDATLEAYRFDKPITTPTWGVRSNGDVSVQLRHYWTMDDLLFYGFAVWARVNDASGKMIDAYRVPPSRWNLTGGSVKIDNRVQRVDDVILFIGWDEGLLVTAASYIIAAQELHRQVRQRVHTPFAHTLLKHLDPNTQMTRSEILTMVDDFADTRRGENGAVSYVPPEIAVEFVGGTDIALFEQGRNAEVLDIARFTGVPAALLEASSVSSSLTYQTQETARVRLHDTVRNRYAFITSRLSLDDVTARGTRVAFNLAHTLSESANPTPAED